MAKARVVAKSLTQVYFLSNILGLRCWSRFEPKPHQPHLAAGTSALDLVDRGQHTMCEQFPDLISVSIFIFHLRGEVKYYFADFVR